ncbi:Regulatory protein YrvL [Terribacillus halophilus]|uniref:Regulatory protein YrvL n=2 Tax=Terribacillus halophilus TaxID=361279 RepID=A0A1G6LGZ4_9BACI|nr:Regulatory protein YrvL [Terribacillus halophilus]
MKQNEDSKILLKIILSILVVCSIAFVGVIYYFGFLGAFSILGVAYESPKHLAVFVGIYLILSIIGELFVKAFYYILIKKTKTQTFHEYMFAFSLNFLMNWIIISIVNGLYKPVDLAWYTEIVLAAFIALTEVTLDLETKKKKGSRTK